MYFQTCPPDWDVESDKERPRTSIPAGDPCCFHFVLVFVFVFVLFLAFDKKKILIILIISTILIISLQRCFLVTWPLFMHLEQMAFRLSLNRFIENCLNRFFVCFFDIFWRHFYDNHHDHLEHVKVSLGKDAVLPSLMAGHPSNREKNRYNNVLPYDHTLVKLRF